MFANKKIPAKLQAYDSNLEELKNLEASGNVTLSKIEEKYQSSIKELDEDISVVTKKLQSLEEFKKYNILYFYSYMALMVILNIIYFPISLVSFITYNIILTISYSLLLFTISNTFRRKVITIFKKENKKNLENEKGNLLLFKNAYEKHLEKINKRKNKQETLEQNTDSEVLKIKKEAEEVIEKYYLSDKIKTVLNMENQYLVDKDYLEELEIIILNLKELLQRINKINSEKQKSLLVEIKEECLDALCLYDILDEQYDNNIILKLWRE